MIDAWNTGNGAAFAAPFTDDADFVVFEGTPATEPSDAIDESKLQSPLITQGKKNSASRFDTPMTKIKTAHRKLRNNGG
jgi:hypothetical protein